MADIDPKDLFFTQTELDLQQAVKFTENALHGADDGELYLEYTLSEAFSFDDNRLKAASFDTAQGFGLRAVNDEAVGYAHATDLSPAALKRAADSLTPVLAGHRGTWAQAPNVAGSPLYVAENPLDSAGFTDKVALLNEINAFTRARDNRVRQVSVALS
ncbi:MAG: DNA gyrase modulator, partial [Pseudomonadota bacterium]|nr:DNA gyrase modulator [Pseudomonadota bacterium]